MGILPWVACALLDRCLVRELAVLPLMRCLDARLAAGTVSLAILIGTLFGILRLDDKR